MKSLEFGECEKASTAPAKHEAVFRFPSDPSFLCSAHLSVNRSVRGYLLLCSPASGTAQSSTP